MTKPFNNFESQDDSSPVVRELEFFPEIEAALLAFQDLPGCLLLDSAMQIQNGREEPSESDQPLGRYSFLMADPFDQVIVPTDSPNPFSGIESLLEKFKTNTVAGLPPMQGGLAGLFSYDLNRSLEKIEAPGHDEFRLPAIALGAYDTVVAWDHHCQRAWIISQGFPETEMKQREERAELRADFFQERLEQSKLSRSIENKNWTTNCQPSIDITAPNKSVEKPEGLISNFSPEGFVSTVQKCIDFIYAGDVFQINFAQRLLYPANCHSVELFRRLRQCNPAPFACYFDLEGLDTEKCNESDSATEAVNCNAQIISASPERLCSVRNGLVETRPIKGTRRRTGRPMVDIQAREELLSSEKDRSENVMIVDLMRSDLSRVCEDDSVTVTQLCEIEEYQSVMHLVSAVQGSLKSDLSLVDLLKAVFPGGSITGAPKVRAMEIISETEQVARGAYCGSMGYLGFDGQADLNILIRTITASGGYWQIPVGGGIVAPSEPEKEFEETWTKAAGMLRAVTMQPKQEGMTTNP